MASHVYGLQLTAFGGVQLPAPSQYAAGLAMPPAPSQLGVAQVVELPGGVPHVSRSAPLHWAWQSPVPEHAVRPPCGLPTTGRHLPTLPLTSQASHCPSHLASQHVPSTQKPLPHSVVVVQVAPVGLLHVPLPFASQRNPVEQLAVVQQTPSTQWPLLQSVAAVHTVPGSPLVTHEPAMQE